MSLLWIPFMLVMLLHLSSLILLVMASCINGARDFLVIPAHLMSPGIYYAYNGDLILGLLCCAMSAAGGSLLMWKLPDHFALPLNFFMVVFIVGTPTLSLFNAAQPGKVLQHLFMTLQVNNHLADARVVTAIIAVLCMTQITDTARPLPLKRRALSLPLFVGASVMALFVGWYEEIAMNLMFQSWLLSFMPKWLSTVITITVFVLFHAPLKTWWHVFSLVWYSCISLIIFECTGEISHCIFLHWLLDTGAFCKIAQTFRL